MSFDITEYNTVRIIKCSGSIDAFNAGEFQKNLIEAIDNSKGNIGMDLKEVTYVSSAGLRAFMVAYKKLDSRGDSMYLISPNAHIVELLKITGLQAIMKTVNRAGEIPA